MKKIIVSIVIISFLILAGCYYQEQMKPGDYKFDDNSTMKIITTDSVYNFNGDDYYLGNDTLFGKVSKKIDERKTLITNVEIPIEDIVSVELEWVDAFETTLTIIGVLAGLFAVFVFSFGGV
ncbi:hypothetical protein ACFLSS_02525 [Bacteroidota bacterium]